MTALRRRLTALFAGLACLVLGLMLAVTFYMASDQYVQAQTRSFLQSVDSLQEKLVAGMVADEWLAQLEARLGAVVYIQDGGRPLLFTGGWQPAGGRGALMAELARQARQNGAELALTPYRARRLEWEFTGPGGAPYRAVVQQLTLPGPLCLAVAQSLAPQRAALRRMGAQYLGLFLLGAGALALISWLLAGLAVRPAAQAARRQSEFIAAASHELRSPLAVIAASLDAAQQGAADPAAMLGAARREARRMGRLVDDLLLLAGSDAGSWRIQRAPLEADTLLLRAYEQLLPLAQAAGRPLALRLPQAPLPALLVDEERLVQLFAILVNNALEYAPPNTPVELAAWQEKRQVCFAVADHGPGVPDAAKPRLFQRFYRGDASRTGKAHFGLGLAVAQELAALHGGRLWVQDTPGGGATFILGLPLGGQQKQWAGPR